MRTLLILAALALAATGCSKTEERPVPAVVPPGKRCPPGQVAYGDVCRIVVDTGGA